MKYRSNQSRLNKAEETARKNLSRAIEIKDENDKPFWDWVNALDRIGQYHKKNQQLTKEAYKT